MKISQIDSILLTDVRHVGSKAILITNAVAHSVTQVVLIRLSDLTINKSFRYALIDIDVLGQYRNERRNSSTEAIGCAFRVSK
jgi:hypothetical protein